ncbi:hypothetical protein CTAYLR_002106 [Chrysophaeum taylorii]|uniref:EF-hand domain-containing protein n=1 Tax=Chrysophaeum taylorii TaxID=2483200 RepID=A0AAD7XTT3_9STRA|nr:hypothetical protein CTAYLR_002106 [Chrysophaeum taylorii]
MTTTSCCKSSSSIASRYVDELFGKWLGREDAPMQVEEWQKGTATDFLEARSYLLKQRPTISPVHPRKPLPRLRRRSASVCDDEELVARWRAALCISGEDEGLELASFAPLASEFCELPVVAGPLIFLKLAKKNNGRFVCLGDFLDFWRDLKKLKKKSHRLFEIIVSKSRGISREDLDPLLKYVVSTHPGLAFLEEHLEFQLKYSQTVVTRIFYRINLSRTGFVSRRELAKANPCLVEALFRLESTDDVNAEVSYFSYEHFYVLYCCFWDLDSDKDGKLHRLDVLKYGGHRLSRAIVDRIFSFKDHLSYPDFVYFMLSEEDKTTEASLRYWFDAVDLDGDGIISKHDARHFYDIQAQRMECLGHEVVPLDDVLCQMADLLEVKTLRLSITHFLDKIRVSGVFFDALFSLDKFVAFEQRDPFAERLKRDDPFDTDWDRFAAAEYARLADDDDDPAASAAASASAEGETNYGGISS